MILDAQQYDTFDRCPKRYAYERTHEPRTISLLGLLYHGVEGALLGNPDAISEITQRMDVSSGDLSPISAVRHVQYMAEVIGLALREKLGQVSRPDKVPLGEHTWRTSLFECKTGLHRIILTSHMDDDSLRSFAHSWQTIGELAALERGITLTVVIVGSQRGGRRHSPWAKGFLHPIQRNLRFAPRKKDSGFTENWKICWREQTETKAETWLDRMKTDGVLDELIESRKVLYRSDDQRMCQARKEMLHIAKEMQSARPEAPMRRSSCDEIGRGACSFQACCYSPTPATPDDFPHLYRRRETPLVTLAG